MSTISPPEPRHGIAELLRLVGTVRLAFDRTLHPVEALGRIRDAFPTTTIPRGPPFPHSPLLVVPRHSAPFRLTRRLVVCEHPPPSG